MKIKYYIPTRNRAGMQNTIDFLPKEILKDTFLVCDKNQVKDYISLGKKNINKNSVISFPPNYGDNIINRYGCFSDKKQWILDNATEDYLYFLDDDLKFSIRKKGKLVNANLEETKEAFKIMNDWLEKQIAHVALSSREGNNRVEEDYVENSRATRVVGFNIKILREEEIKLNRLLLMADFDVTLALLKKGYRNRVLFSYANGQRKSNDAGGCSLYRSPETMKIAALRLSFLNKGLVKVKRKTTVKPWAGFESNERYDVTISWKKAFYFGKARSKNNITDFFNCQIMIY